MKNEYFEFSELFDQKPCGIFSLLDDECKLKEPSVENFSSKLHFTWNNSDLKPSSSKAIKFDHIDSKKFAVNHFAGPVHYSTVNIYFYTYFYIFFDLHSFKN